MQTSVSWFVMVLLNAREMKASYVNFAANGGGQSGGRETKSKAYKSDTMTLRNLHRNAGGERF